MLDFQNRAPDIKLLKIHTKLRQWYLLRKTQFSTKVCLPILNHYWIRSVKKSLGVVSDPDSEYTQNEGNLNWHFSQFVSKNVIFCKRLQTQANYILLENIFCYKYEFGLLPQNKAMFGSDPLAKFPFLQVNACR